ncbi:hypothetical protein HDU96_006807 [Phlyctochytrium bullatum]|nr:hypothetical protein HDU96_006807 [Phlyctochytrium bullatum]
MDRLKQLRLDQLPIAKLIANRKLSSVDQDIARVNASISCIADEAPFLALSVPPERIDEARAVVRSLETALAEVVDEAERERLEEERVRETAVLEALCNDEELYLALEVNHIMPMAALGEKMEKLFVKQAELLQQKTALETEKENIAKEQAWRHKSRKEQMRTITAQVKKVDKVLKKRTNDARVIKTIEREEDFRVLSNRLLALSKRIDKKEAALRGPEEDFHAKVYHKLLVLTQRIEEEEAVFRGQEEDFRSKLSNRLLILAHCDEEEEAVNVAVDAAEKEKLEESGRCQTSLLEVNCRHQPSFQEDDVDRRKPQATSWKLLDSDFRRKFKLLKEKATLVARKEELKKEEQGQYASRSVESKDRKKKSKRPPSLRRQVLLKSLKVND